MDLGQYLHLPKKASSKKKKLPAKVGIPSPLPRLAFDVRDSYLLSCSIRHWCNYRSNTTYYVPSTEARKIPPLSNSFHSKRVARSRHCLEEGRLTSYTIRCARYYTYDAEMRPGCGVTVP